MFNLSQQEKEDLKVKPLPSNSTQCLWPRPCTKVSIDGHIFCSSHKARLPLSMQDTASVEKVKAWLGIENK